MYSGSKPENMCMPPKCSSLSCEGKIVHIHLARLNRALGYVCRPISPACSQLSDSMPIQYQFIIIFKKKIIYKNSIDQKLYNYELQQTHQWMLTLYLTWLTTFTRTVSSSLAQIVGPGNFPFTVTMGLVEHILVAFFITT